MGCSSPTPLPIVRKENLWIADLTMTQRVPVSHDPVHGGSYGYSAETLPSVHAQKNLGGLVSMPGILNLRTLAAGSGWEPWLQRSSSPQNVGASAVPALPGPTRSPRTHPPRGHQATAQQAQKSSGSPGALQGAEDLRLPAVGACLSPPRARRRCFSKASLLRAPGLQEGEGGATAARSRRRGQCLP